MNEVNFNKTTSPWDLHTKLVNVIIPVHRTHNRPCFLGAALGSVARQRVSSFRIECILIGDGCEPDKALMPPGLPVNLFCYSRSVGVSQARSKGVQMAQGSVVVFLDADCVAEETWLENLTQSWDPDIGVRGGRVLDAAHRCLNEKGAYGEGAPLPFVGFANAAFRREIFEAVGPFEGKYGGEDLDFCWRACLKGYRVEYRPEAVVRHWGQKSFLSFFLKGRRARFFIRKFGNLLPLRHPLNFRKNSERILDSFLIACGYGWERLWEKTEDSLLQAASTVIPLNVTLHSKPLVKPLAVVWWRARQGGRILNLGNQKEYQLDGLSQKIWEGLLSQKTVEEIAGFLSEEVDEAENKLCRDAEQFMRSLYEEKLLNVL